MEKLRAQRLHATQISETLKREMYSLFEGYYKEVSYDGFCKDLVEKNCVLCFFSDHGLQTKMIGFSTQMKRVDVLPDGRTVKYLFSGDTVMHHEYWGSKILQTSFFWFIVSEKLKSPLRPVYWMLMSKGYKTFLMMRRNFKSSFPAPHKETPAHIQLAQDSFYARKFGMNYLPERGVIEFSTSHGAVKDSISEPSAHVRQNNDVSFFLARNPDYGKGTELACIAEIRFLDFPTHIFKYFLKPFMRISPKHKISSVKAIP